MPVPPARGTRDIDWNRTIRANLGNYLPDHRTVVPERLIGHARAARAVRKEVVLCVDQSGSMAASLVYASVFGAVLASMRSLSTRLVVFDTSVADLTDRLHDPVDLLFGTRLGGGTDINRALAHCQSRITRPSDTVVVLISDLYEGGMRDEMLKRVASMTASGVQVVALLALSDDGAPSYDREHAAALAALGVPAFACTDRFPEVMAAALNAGRYRFPKPRDAPGGEGRAGTLRRSRGVKGRPRRHGTTAPRVAAGAGAGAGAVGCAPRAPAPPHAVGVPGTTGEAPAPPGTSRPRRPGLTALDGSRRASRAVGAGTTGGRAPRRRRPGRCAPRRPDTTSAHGAPAPGTTTTRGGPPRPGAPPHPPHSPAPPAPPAPTALPRTHGAPPRPRSAAVNTASPRRSDPPSGSPRLHGGSTRRRVVSGRGVP